MKKQFAIIGLGRFGGSVTKELVEQGADVLAIDSDRTKADEFRDIATQVVIANATDEQVLRELDIPLYEHVVVAIGNDIEASILATLLLSEMGVKHICVKAETDHHEKVLKKSAHIAFFILNGKWARGLPITFYPPTLSITSSYRLRIRSLKQ